MPRLVIGFLVVLLSSCATDRLATVQQNLAYAAQERLKNTLAFLFTNELGKGVGSVIATLAQPGGYLDNPLARILLPPPLGLAFDVARDMQANPKATLLTALMNHAAEQAIPGAAPIIQAALNKVTPVEARQLLDGDKTAAAEYLKAKTAESLREVLTPLVAADLTASGAQQVYGELLDTYQAQRTPAIDEKTVTLDESKRDLAQYVTAQAVDGAFKALGAQETRIRDNLSNLAGGAL